MNYETMFQRLDRIIKNPMDVKKLDPKRKAYRNYKPNIVVDDIEKISHEEWLKARKKGIGGSDAGVIMGISKFKILKELYYDKINPNNPTENEENWFAKDYGHHNESFVLKAFQKMTGLRPYTVRHMFQHPKYPWMLVNCDGFLQLPDGRIFIIEVKTCSFNTLKDWGSKNSNVIPPAYIAQGAHAMAVTNTDGVIFLCMGDNNLNGYRIRIMERDYELEEYLIQLEANFWLGHVQKGIEPKSTEEPKLVLERYKKMYKPKNDTVTLPDEMLASFQKMDSINEKINSLKKEISMMEEKVNVEKEKIESYLKGREGKLVSGTNVYTVKNVERKTTSVPADKIPLLRMIPGASDYIVESTTYSQKIKKETKKITKESDG